MRPSSARCRRDTRKSVGPCKTIPWTDRVVYQDANVIARRLECLFAFEHHGRFESEAEVGHHDLGVILVWSKVMHRGRGVDADKD